ncbi:MAG TPA: hypothetical protein VFI84_02325, partial [Candidatus Saccharimonadales bacterium]|nr:hypothetical protein [Candidatus Saccharimonadales bacterium]
AAAEMPVPAATEEAVGAPEVAENVDVKPATPEPAAEEQPEEELAPAEDKTPPTKPEEETEKIDEEPSEEPAEAKDEDKDGEDDVPEQAKSDPDAAAKEAERLAAEHAAAIQKLADGHEYYLPIETTESRKTKHFVILGALLILLLAAAWVDVALDAGLIQFGGLKPVTHFFKQPVANTPAVSAPRKVNKTFTAPASKLSFRYPEDWQLNSTGTVDRDTVSLSPGTPSTSSLGDVNVIFLSLPVTSPANSLTVKAVYYQKLTHKISGDVYLRDLIYTDGSGKINLVSSLGDDHSVKAGQTIQTDQQSFTGVDGKSQNYFAITVVRVASGVAKFDSVADAQKYLHSTEYQQARTILLSTNVAK